MHERLCRYGYRKDKGNVAMYDADTLSNIYSAPELAEAVLQDLPRNLTRAFTKIVATRVRMQSLNEGGEFTNALREDNNFIQNLKDLGRIAAAYEACAVLMPPNRRDERAAAAFVAASSYRTLFHAQAEHKNPSYLGPQEVSADICAMLLFLLSESHADAIEEAQRIVLSANARPVEKELIAAVKNLSLGNLEKIVNIVPPEVDSTSECLDTTALDTLHLMILQGVVSLAKDLCGLTLPDSDDLTTLSIFENVREMCTENINIGSSETGAMMSIYAGPLHLTNLLRGLKIHLIKSAVINIESPNGIRTDNWTEFLRNTCRQRPYIWKNHKLAIDQRYLDIGISSTVSFPTGAGKSTLSEFKIAATLLRGMSVIYLAPTHALVSQTQNNLKDIVKGKVVISNIEGSEKSNNAAELGDITVMTPERCLMLTSIDPDAFVGIGLVVFDECHHLNSQSSDPNQRSVDAMLAILNLNRIASNADMLLMSAMMENAKEMASWVEHLTGGSCLALDGIWKPTRQVRGCIVYDQDHIDIQNRHENTSINVIPYGLFCLQQHWPSYSQENYELVRLLPEDGTIPVKFKKENILVPKQNVNEVARRIANSTVKARLKTLIFVQKKNECDSCARKISLKPDDKEVSLTHEEQLLWEEIKTEMGDARHCYLEVNDDGTLKRGAVIHNGLLLHEERRLHEQLFQRPDGVMAMVATTTVNQGMNFPSEVVIIAGHRPRRTKTFTFGFQIHDILNAAGRAGRAGRCAQGVVLLIPSDPISFNKEDIDQDRRLTEIENIFSRQDKCVRITDPLQALIDKIHNEVSNGVDVSEQSSYFLRRLPLKIIDEEVEPAEILMRKSLCAFKATKDGNEAWLEERMSTALSARPVNENIPESERWIEQVANATGLPTDLLYSLLLFINKGECGIRSDHAIDVVGALICWILQNPEYISKLIRPENIKKLNSEYENNKDSRRVLVAAVYTLGKLWMLWMLGDPLCKLEQCYNDGRGMAKCERARHFALNTSRDISFIASLPNYLMAARAKAYGSDYTATSVLANLSRVVREGCINTDALAIRLILYPNSLRVSSNWVYQGISDKIEQGDVHEDFDTTMNRVRTAFYENIS